jgi:hypothetical protein
MTARIRGSATGRSARRRGTPLPSFSIDPYRRILGPFLSIEDPDTFFFMRGFPDLPSREPMKAQFYEGELWKKELEHVLMPMLDKYDVVLVDDPDNFIRW